MLDFLDHLEYSKDVRGDLSPSPLPTSTILNMDVREGLRSLKTGSVHCILTSPPYYGLRSYGLSGPDVYGLEPTLDEYIAHTVEIFEEAKRVLHPSGTFWLNLGDRYAGGGVHVEPHKYAGADAQKPRGAKQPSLHSKNLLMVPARVALALQSAGWILRQDIVWVKGMSMNPCFSGSVMPESTKDRPTWAHEHVFLFSKNPTYFYDQEGNREPLAPSTLKQFERKYAGTATKPYEANGVQNPSELKRRMVEKRLKVRNIGGRTDGLTSPAGLEDTPSPEQGRNLRNVWVIQKENFPGQHFATFPTKLASTIIKLGTSERGVCPTCLTPWTREVVKEAIPDEVQAQFEAARADTTSDTGREDGHTQRKPNFKRKVLGDAWVQGCECEPQTPIPATVCDPFNGSGRSGIAAKRLGRSYVGIDVNPDYCQMAEKAIEEA